MTEPQDPIVIDNTAENYTTVVAQCADCHGMTHVYFHELIRVFLCVTCYQAFEWQRHVYHTENKKPS